MVNDVRLKELLSVLSLRLHKNDKIIFFLFKKKKRTTYNSWENGKVIVKLFQQILQAGRKTNENLLMNKTKGERLDQKYEIQIQGK